MNLLANPGVARADYEFWAFVVSAIHGCGACLDSHEEELRALGWSAPQIQVGLKIAAIVHAVATVLRAEGL
jgi:alkyl hydroperoxide reductase subunit D